MTYSPTNSVPSTTTRVNYFTGIARRRRKLSLIPANGDGSTLSLDFTTGVLDPRLTFTRTTNATFINSQGLVEWANSNMMLDTGITTTTGAPWNPFLAGTGSNTNSSATVVSDSGSSGRAFYRQSINVSQGLQYSIAVDITDQSGGERADWVLLPSNASATQYYLNGASINATDPVTTGVLCAVITTSSTTTEVRFGVGANGTSANKQVTWTRPRMTLGVRTNPVFLSNTSLTLGNYNTPRFDYDPSTLQPRGLLIEGSANNLCEQGQYCWGTGATKIWVRSAGINVNSVNGSGGANIIARIDGPDGGSLTGTSVVKDAGLSFVRFNVDVTVAASTTYTFSAYVRAPSGGNPYMRLAAFNGGTWLATTGGTTASGITITDTANNGSRFNGVPSTAWVRVWVTFTTQAGQTAATIAFYPDTDTTSAATMYVWGAQVETGSGPSSLIPTGASTGSRGQDGMTMADISSLNFNQSGGTVMMQIDGGPRDLNTFPYFAQFEKSPSGRGWGFLRMNVSSTVGPRIFGTAFDNAGSVIITASNHLRPSGKIKFATTLEPSVARMTWVIAGGSALVNTAAAGTLATIGSLKFNNTTETAATDFGSVWVSQFKYWPTVLPESQMQAITT